MNASKYKLLGSLQQFLDDAENSQAPTEWTNTKRYIGILGIALCMKNDIQLSISPENIFFDENFYCHIIKSKISNSSSTASSNVFSFGQILYNIITLKRGSIEFDKIKWPKNQEFIRKCVSEESSERPSISEICRYIITKGFIDLFGEIDYDEVNTFLDTFGSDDEISLLKGIFNYESNIPKFNEKAKIILKKLAEKGNKEAETFYEKSFQIFGGYDFATMVFLKILDDDTSYKIYVWERMKISELKEYISERTGYPKEGSLLFINSKVHNDDEWIRDCGVQKGVSMIFIRSKTK